MTRSGKLTCLACAVLALATAAWLVSRMGHVPPEPGHTPGRRMRGLVSTSGEDVWMLRFPGGQTAEVQVHGESILQCSVLDPAGHLLGADTNRDAPCRVRWVPSRTGSYRIVISNFGPEPIRYELVTN